jgi:hypothetical protein
MTFGARPMSSSISANFSLKLAVIRQSACANEPGYAAEDELTEMTAFGTERTWQRPSVMSAHQGKADIEATIRQVR